MNKILSSAVGGLALLAISFGANALVIDEDVHINGNSSVTGNTMSFTNQTISDGTIDGNNLTSGWAAQMSNIQVPLTLGNKSPSLSVWTVTQAGNEYKLKLDSVSDYTDLITGSGKIRSISFSGAGTLTTNMSTDSAAALFALTAQFYNKDGAWLPDPAKGSNSTMTVQVVPIPAAAYLFGSALVGLVGIARRRRSTQV